MADVRPYIEPPVTSGRPGLRALRGAGEAKVKVDHLSFFYDRFQALHEVTFDIPERRITAIIGPSGCGKSTLLRVFNRMYDLVPKAHASGAVALDPVATLKIEDLMSTLTRDFTIVIVTHNMQQAARVSDFTAFMLMNPEGRYGELIEFAPTADLFNQPQDDRTEAYITGRFG